MNVYFSGRGQRPKSPLEYAIDRGFHSLVQILLEGGAVQDPCSGYRSPMSQALAARRFDIVQLLVKHGFDPKWVDMREVFATWDPAIMNYFIERGADLVTNDPFADAFCNKIRSALGVFKNCRQRMPELMEQANIALRHHCHEGNEKWVSLMIWAGADPYVPGTEKPDEKLGDHDDGLTALGFAGISYQFDVLATKALRALPVGAEAAKELLFFTRGRGLPVLKDLLERGLNPNDEANGGCSAIQHALEHMSW